MDEAERPTRPLRRRPDRGEGFLPQPGRRHVDGLLEERAFEGIRLVEDRQDVEIPVREQTLHGHLDAGDVLLDEDLVRCGAALRGDFGAAQDRLDPPPRREEGFGVVGPYDAPAAREKSRLQNAGIVHSPRRLGRVVV